MSENVERYIRVLEGPQESDRLSPAGSFTHMSFRSADTVDVCSEYGEQGMQLLWSEICRATV